MRERAFTIFSDACLMSPTSKRAVANHPSLLLLLEAANRQLVDPLAPHNKSHTDDIALCVRAITNFIMNLLGNNVGRNTGWVLLGFFRKTKKLNERN